MLLSPTHSEGGGCVREVFWLHSVSGSNYVRLPHGQRFRSWAFFVFEDRKSLMRARCVERVREAATKAGLDCSSFLGHSFHMGAATTVASRGINDATINMLEWWKS